MLTKGCLYIVASPIGNYKDITLRAIEILQTADAVICEEYREGSTLLEKLGIKNKLISLNEHNEATQALEIMEELRQSKTFALISDAGTPVFSDPGHFLIHLLVKSNISIVPVPGPSSLMAALSVCDFKVERFLFEGFLPREKNERRRKLQQLRSAKVPILIMDAPYRMQILLQDVADIFGIHQQIILACDLTLSSEHIYRGEIKEILQQIEKKKSEYVLIIK